MKTAADISSLFKRPIRLLKFLENFIYVQISAAIWNLGLMWYMLVFSTIWKAYTLESENFTILQFYNVSFTTFKDERSYLKYSLQ